MNKVLAGLLMLLSLMRAAEENKALSERRQDQRFYLPEQPTTDDYRKVQQQYLNTQKSALSDQRSMMDNGFRVGRIQQGFVKVRTGIASRLHLHYDWFTVPNGNGVGSY